MSKGKNMAPNREITDLRSRLRLPETRAQTIAAVARSYQRLGTIEATAAEHGVSRETLTRCEAAYPELKAAIDRIREARLVLR